MRKLVIVLAVLMLIPAGASAGVIAESWVSTGGLTITLNGSTISTLSGWAKVTVTDAASMSPLALGTTYDAFCVDLLHWSNSSSVGAQTAALSSWNLYQATPEAQRAAANTAAWLLNTYLPVAGTNLSALQIAIWEVLYETTSAWNATSGNVSFSNATLDAVAQGYLNAAATAGAQTYAGNAVWIVTDNRTDGYYQDFATVVPEPSSMLLLGTGLLGVAAVIRRRPRK